MKRIVSLFVCFTLILAFANVSVGFFAFAESSSENLEGNETTSTQSNAQKATPSQLNTIADNIIKKKIELIFSTNEVRCGTSVEFELMLGGEEFKELTFQAIDGNGNTLKLDYNIFMYGQNSIKGDLNSSELPFGEWTVVLYNDGEEVVREKIFIQKVTYKVKFLEYASKRIGRTDPGNISRKTIYIEDEEGNRINRNLVNFLLIREAGEEVGVYKINDIISTVEGITYILEDNEYAYLEIITGKVSSKSLSLYIDANEEQEIFVDLKPEFPQYIKNPVISLGDINSVSKDLKEIPSIYEAKVNIKLKIPAKTRNIEIPVLVKSDNYEDFIITIKVRVCYIQEHSKEEIKRFYQSHPFSLRGDIRYEVQPGFSPYIAGRLSREDVEDGLNALNFVRYVAGLDSNVTIDDTYEMYHLL